MHEISAEMRRF